MRKNKQKKKTPNYFLVVGALVGVALITSALGNKPSVPSNLTFEIKEVIDGDTILLENNQQVRYIGIDTPEIGQKGADIATQRNKELVLGKVVKLERDTLYKDQHDRILAYVWVGKLMVNEEMLKEGLARPLFIPPDDRYQSLFIDAINKAQAKKLGLWALE